MNKKFGIVVALLSLLVLPLVLAEPVDNKTLCMQDPVCNNLVQKNTDVLKSYDKDIKTLYEYYGRLTNMYNKKKATLNKKTDLKIKLKFNQLYGKILEVEDWTFALYEDMETATNNYDVDELGDVLNAIYDPLYEINAAHKMINELKDMLKKA